MNWTCNDTRYSMRRQLELPEEAIEHLASCELCQQVSDLATVADESEAESPLDLDGLLGSTRRVLAHERGLLAWLRSRRLAFQVALGLGAALLPIVLQVVFARRPDLADFPAPRMLVFVVAYTVAIVYANNALLKPLFRTQLPGTSWIALVLGAAVPVVFVVTNSDPDGTSTRIGADVLRASYHCLRYGVLLAIPSFVLLLAMERTAARRPLTKLVAAVMGGAVGNFVLLLHCSNPESAHQLLGHALVGVVLLLLVGVAGILTKIGLLR